MRKANVFVVIMIAFIALTVTLTTVRADQTTVITRIDLAEGKKPKYSEIAFLPKGYEFWTIGIGQNNPWVRFGRLKPISRSLSAGVLISVTGQKKYFNPSFSFKKKVGKGSVYSVIDYYSPINGGRWILSLAEMRYLTPINKRINVGVAGHFWAEQGMPNPVHFGPAFQIKTGKTTSCYARIAVLGDSPASARIQFSTSW
ncbi:MAG: hypothetical protein PHU42_02345 [Patescibacteria group bacterium]|nr:hypothetical protein [Patescibacteria group bacterium]